MWRERALCERFLMVYYGLQEDAKLWQQNEKSHVVTLVIFWLFLKGWHMKYHRKASFASLFVASFGLMWARATNHKLFLMSEFGAAGCNGTSPSYREQYPFVRPQKWNQGVLQRQRTCFFLSVTARPALSQWVNSHFCSSTISPLPLTRKGFFFSVGRENMKSKC